MTRILTVILALLMIAGIALLLFGCVNPAPSDGEHEMTRQRYDGIRPMLDTIQRTTP